jgi:hypothetical protein
MVLAAAEAVVVVATPTAVECRRAAAAAVAAALATSVVCRGISRLIARIPAQARAAADTLAAAAAAAAVMAVAAAEAGARVLAKQARVRARVELQLPEVMIRRRRSAQRPHALSVTRLDTRSAHVQMAQADFSGSGSRKAKMWITKARCSESVILC